MKNPKLFLNKSLKNTSSGFYEVDNQDQSSVQLLTGDISWLREWQHRTCSISRDCPRVQLLYSLSWVHWLYTSSPLSLPGHQSPKGTKFWATWLKKKGAEHEQAALQTQSLLCRHSISCQVSSEHIYSLQKRLKLLLRWLLMLNGAWLIALRPQKSMISFIPITIFIMKQHFREQNNFEVVVQFD